MRRFYRTFKSQELFRRLSGLSPVAIELYGFLLEKCDWRLGRHVSSSAAVAKELNVSERSIQRANKELEKADLLRVRRGIYAMNPEFNWGGRSWNIAKATYYTMNRQPAQIIDFAEASEALNEKRGEPGGKLWEKSLPGNSEEVKHVEYNPKAKTSHRSKFVEG